MNKTWPQLSGHSQSSREITCEQTNVIQQVGATMQGRYKVHQGSVVSSIWRGGENDSRRSQRRGKFIKWFENVILKDTRWALESTRSRFEFWLWHIIPWPRASYFLNFSFLIDKMGMMNFLIGLNDAKRRLSIPWWLSEVYLRPRLFSILTSKFIYSATYLTSPLNIGISNLTGPAPNFESICLDSLPPMVFPKPVKGSSTRVR